MLVYQREHLAVKNIIGVHILLQTYLNITIAMDTYQTILSRKKDQMNVPPRMDNHS
jgi:hypothetical protein